MDTARCKCLLLLASEASIIHNKDSNNNYGNKRVDALGKFFRDKQGCF